MDSDKDIIEYLCGNNEGVSFEQIRSDVFGCAYGEDYTLNLFLKRKLESLVSDNQVIVKKINNRQRYFLVE